MTETTIRSLPDGRWELLRVYDTWDQAAEAFEQLLLADQWPDETVELAEPPWDGKFRAGDEGLTRDGRPYRVTGKGATTITVIVHGAAFAETLQHRIDGRFTWQAEHGRDLMPPTTRGPKP